MKILKIDKKNNQISFIPQNVRDLWVLKSIVQAGDSIKGSSQRRVKDQESTKNERKPIFVEVVVEKQEFSSSLCSLRFTGKIVFSKPEEFAPIGEYHTLEVCFLNKYTLTKKNIFQHQLSLLKESTKSQDNITIVVLDDEEASVFLYTGFEITQLTKIRSGKAGKFYAKHAFDVLSYFKEIASVVINQKNEILVAGNGLTKDEFSKYLREKHAVQSYVTSLSNTSLSSINELLSKKEVLKFFENSIIFKEKQMLDRFKENLGKNNSLYVYGLKDIQEVLPTGACEFIMLSFSLWEKSNQSISELLKIAEKVNTKVFVVDASHQEIIASLDSFGGIIGVLRYKVY